MTPPADYFRDNPDALRAYELIEAAQIPPEPQHCPFADYATNDAYNAALRVYKAAVAERRVRIRDVAAEIARQWPGWFMRSAVHGALLEYVEDDAALDRLVMQVFDAAGEEAAAMNLQETNNYESFRNDEVA